VKELKGINCQLGSSEGTTYPFFVQWHLTEKCNLHCLHCYQQTRTGEMPREEICKAIDLLAETVEYWVTHYDTEVSPGIHFTGGEPLVREDLFELLLHARHRGFYTSLMSNGTLMTDKKARELRDAGIQDVQISLDGTEPVHDTIRGKGSFQNAVGGICNLVAAGVETNINMTVSELNYTELDPLLRLAEQLGVSTVGFSRLVPCGRGKELLEQVLTPEHLSLLSQQVADKSRDGGVLLVSRDPLIRVANIANDTDIPQTDFPVGGCSAGIFGVTITADGTIMPCRRMDLAIGNIKTDNFRELWMESPVLVALRDRHSYHGNCQSCRFWTVCRGCRAIALACAREAGNEDYLGDDHQCAHFAPTAS
jgi:AdoMet-dependent heme synthase